MQSDIHRRLVHAKYILERASSIQAERNEMSVSISVLLMHDAVELLMLAVLDHLNAPANSKREFKDFWSLVKQATGKDAPDRIPMDKLNQIRIGFKHKGALPNPAEAADLLARTRGFFENVLSIFCSQSYDSISLIDLVPDIEIRKRIAEARQKFLKGDKDNAMVDLQIAFHDLQHPKDKVIPRIKAPKPPSLPSELKRAGWENYLQSLHSFMESSATATNALMLGVDPLQYANFVAIGPNVQWTFAGTPSVALWRTYEDFTIEKFDDLISFLIDYALKVSEVYVPKTLRLDTNLPTR
jgi:hypothetical protein